MTSPELGSAFQPASSNNHVDRAPHTPRSSRRYGSATRPKFALRDRDLKTTIASPNLKYGLLTDRERGSTRLLRPNLLRTDSSEQRSRCSASCDAAPAIGAPQRMNCRCRFRPFHHPGGGESLRLAIRPESAIFEADTRRKRRASFVDCFSPRRAQEPEIRARSLLPSRCTTVATAANDRHRN